MAGAVDTALDEQAVSLVEPPSVGICLPTVVAVIEYSFH
jgi:hypothetical protein